MTAQDELREWLMRNRQDLYDVVNGGNAIADVARLNAATGLSLRYDGRNSSELCEKFLREFRKGCPMAITPQQLEQMQYAQQQMARNIGMGMAPSLSAQQHSYLGQAAAQQAQQPITPPEPNKVLLLLGEDE